MVSLKGLIMRTWKLTDGLVFLTIFSCEKTESAYLNIINTLIKIY